MDSGGPDGQRRAVGPSPRRQDFEMVGERGIQDDTWEDWADDGIISELKREADSNLAVVYSLQKLKMKKAKECSQTVLE